MHHEFGCEVRVALDGEAAIESVRARLPDLIPLDAMMGSEIRVLELKREVNLLSREPDRERPYPEADEENDNSAAS